MINLLPHKENKENRVSKYKHLFYIATHLSLLVYILFIVGTGAVMLRGSERQTQLGIDIANLESQLTPLSKVEANILHLARTKAKIDKFKSDRAKLTDIAKIINNRPQTVTIKNWDFRTNANSRLSVESQNQSDLEEYTKLLKLKYQALLLEQTVTKGGTWNSILMLK